MPLSLVHAKNTPLDGTAPVLMYGYGAYGNSTPATFSSLEKQDIGGCNIQDHKSVLVESGKLVCPETLKLPHAVPQRVGGS